MPRTFGGKMAPYILIVEDEPDIRELLNFTISRAGYDIVEAENAEDALKLLDRGAPERTRTRARKRHGT